MFFERSAFSPTASKKTPAHTTIFPGSTWRNISRTLQKCPVAPLYRASKEHCKETPAHTTIFPESTSRNIERTLQKMHGCSCTGHLKNTAKMPCCSCTEKKYEQNKIFTETSFSPTGSKKTPAQTRIFLESLPGISKNTEKSSVAPLYRASKEHCKNALWLIYEAKYTNIIADFFEKHLFHQQPARNIRSLNTKRIPKLFHWSPAQERTREDSSLWPRDTVPELPSGTRGCKTSICPALLTSWWWVFGAVC